MARPLQTNESRPTGWFHGRFPPFLRPLTFPFLITLLAIPALQPLFSSQLTCGYDTAFHLWRAVEAGALLREGILYARWAPHMAHGFGYPLFLFQSPLSAIVTAVFNLGGLAWPVALNVTYGLGILASGWTMWLLARRLWGKWGGLIAAVAYLYAPFHAYVAYFRASLSETVAWSLPPLILWGLLTWQQDRQKRGLAAAVWAFVALVFTHDVTAYLFLPLFVGWLLITAWQDRSWGTLWRGVLALGLGIGGSAFFWLPSLTARSLIQFERASSAWPFYYYNNFLPLDQLLALPRNADPQLLNDWPPRGLGILLLGTAVAGLILGWRRYARQRWLIGFMGAALAGTILLTVSPSRLLWDNLPLLATFQFPWRFLAPATLVAALLSGGIELLSVKTQRKDAKGQRGEERKKDFAPFALSAVKLLVITLLSVAHWGWFFPDRCQPPADLSLAGMVAWEFETRTLGTTASRELLPRTVERLPQDEYDLPVWQARLAPSDLPAGARIEQATYDPLRAEIDLETAVPFEARFRSFAFPGWNVTINGKPVAITPSTPEGLITFPVPSGRATVIASFGETPLWLAADALSLLSLLLLAIILTKYQHAPSSHHPITLSPHHPITILFILSLVLLAGKWLLVDNEVTRLRQSYFVAGELLGVERPSSLTFGTAAAPNQIRLLGHDDLPSATPADFSLTIRLYWQALTTVADDLKVGLTLVDDRGVRWSSTDLRDYRWLRNPPPSPAWPPDKFVQTAYFVDLLPGTPPGNYSLRLSLFAPDTLAPLTVFDETGQALGPWTNLGDVTLTDPRQPWPPDVAMQYRLETGSPAFTLWGSNVDRAEAAPGDPALVTLFWESEQSTRQTGTLALVTETEETAVSWPVTFPGYGPGLWRSQERLRLSPDLEDGVYQWQLTLPGGETAVWGNLTINAPERSFTPPNLALPLGVTLGDQATLLGLQAAPNREIAAGDSLTVDLVWRAEAEFEESYRVFVHLLESDGAIVVQSDGEPANWTRPTTGWQPGEIIVDRHTLAIPADLPAGDYQLVTGLYLPGGSRLQAAAGSDAIPLTTVTITP